LFPKKNCTNLNQTTRYPFKVIISHYQVGNILIASKTHVKYLLSQSNMRIYVIIAFELHNVVTYSLKKIRSRRYMEKRTTCTIKVKFHSHCPDVIFINVEFVFKIKINSYTIMVVFIYRCIKLFIKWVCFSNCSP